VALLWHFVRDLNPKARSAGFVQERSEYPDRREGMPSGTPQKTAPQGHGFVWFILSLITSAVHSAYNILSYFVNN